MRHIDSVTFARETLVGASLDGWKTQERPDGSFSVWGPCPKCRGEAFGPPLHAVAERQLVEAEVDGAGVRAACACGYEHDVPGNSRGCGRSWVVPVTSRD